MSTRRRRESLDAAALERLLEVTRQLARPFDLTTLLTQVIEAGRAILHAERGTVFLYDARAHELYSQVATGAAPLRIPADRGIVGECAQTRQLINCPDCYADPRFNREIDRQTGYRTRCLLAVPLVGHDDSLVGVLQVLNKEGGVFDAADEGIAAALAAQCAVALQRMRLMEELVAREKIERELALARDIQMRVLPKSVPRLLGYELAGWSRPADQTGGDIFDIIQLGGESVMLLLGDATGHGIAAALSVTQVRAMLRMGLRTGADLDSAFRHINDQLAADLAANRFVTAFLGLLEPQQHRVSYHSGGQAPLLHYHAADGRCERLGASTMPLGLMPGLKLGAAGVCRLEPGDILALITDGVFEYENAAAEQFGEARVEELLRGAGATPLPRLLEQIVEAVERFAGGAPQHDDMTMLVVRRARDRG